MNRTFDFYEYAGIIIPGVALLVGAMWLFPDIRVLFSKDGITLGELGLFVLVAYAAGQLVQGIGNYLEWLWWKCWGGMPSEQMLAGKFLTASQHMRLVEALRPILHNSEPLAKLPHQEKLAIVREMYSLVANAGKASRIDVFNGNYGLMRGLAAALLVIGSFAVATFKGVAVIDVSVILFLLAVQRMHRFGRHYATELAVQFLALKCDPTGDHSKPAR